MGIFDFVKSVGKQLGIGSEDTPPEAADLKKELDSHDLGTEKIEVAVEGDKAIIKGEVADQSAFEKAIMAIGNSMGVAQVEAAEVKIADASAAGVDAPVFHEVKKGDTLWAISERAYGNGAKYEAIFEANKPMLSHPDKIYPGQMLRIPPLD